MILLDGRHFKDELGRTLMLRGVNLGGSSKVPWLPNGASWNPEGFYDHRNVSFVGRPFPLAEADEHFSRLCAWGFTFLRFIVTWEAIEHAGPGVYDEEYLDYLHKIIEKAGEHGISVFIDPHQDVWSRFTGGDGAPGWTLELVGFDLRQLNASGAAIVHQEHGDPFPRMVWPTNCNKLAAATMFTLFFAGNDFAPQFSVDGVPIQEYLQSHYIQAIQRAAQKLKDLPNVIGYDTLNEPSNGYIGAKDIRMPAEGSQVLMGDTPTILQGMLMGEGYPQRVDVYKLGLTGFRKAGERPGNPEGKRAWLPGRGDIWKAHGVWTIGPNGEPAAARPDYFYRVNGRPVDFHADYLKPFIHRFCRAIRSIVPEAILFVEGVPEQGALTWNASDPSNVVHAAHWYDGITLLRKSFIPWMTVDPDTRKMSFGSRGVIQNFAEQIGRIMRQSDQNMNHAPTLIGEAGIPFDMHKKQAYRSGDFTMQVRALDATLSALERNLASFTLWNYTADNTNERGDQWNDEDLSLFSADQKTGSGSIYDGGRALKAALRPYPCKVAGEPRSLSFDMRKTVFEFTFRHAPGVEAPTEIFIPEYQYPHGCVVEVTDGEFELDRERQLLRYRHTSTRESHTVRVLPV